MLPDRGPSRSLPRVIARHKCGDQRRDSTTHQGPGGELNAQALVLRDPAPRLRYAAFVTPPRGPFSHGPQRLHRLLVAGAALDCSMSRFTAKNHGA